MAFTSRHLFTHVWGLNSRNGSTPTTITTEIGKVTLEIPRDREGSFEPQIVPRHQPRLQ
jgi:transposase-like protein